jgi:hypothetical protein
MSKLKRCLSGFALTTLSAGLVLASSGGNAAEPATPANPTDATAPAATPAIPNPDPSPALASTPGSVSALLGLLVKKGVLAPSEATSIRDAAPGTEFQALIAALSRKGVIEASDLSALVAPPAAPSPAPVMTAPVVPPAAPAPPAAAQKPAGTSPQVPPQIPTGTLPAPPGVIPAVAPVRLLPIDPPAKDGLIPAFKLGPIKMTPYGFIKATTVHDTSNPRGDDFPVPGFLNADTGPTTDPSWHIKARASRVGFNLEWPDASKKLTVTGRVEGDFEGNFSRADNRNVSSLRSNGFQLRLAWVRMDYKASENTDLFFQGGQDWALFGSSVLPNILETTFLAAYFGNVYERSPQMRMGLVQKLGGRRNFKFSPEFAIMMPSEGNVPVDVTTCSVPASFAPGTAATMTCSVSNGLANQLGYGERQGSDANRLEYEGRAVLQWQLDTAPAVAPAQLVVSAFDSQRSAIVLASAIAAPAGSSATAAAQYASAHAAYPHGAIDSSNGYGFQVAAQLPTRWVTLSASAYRGADLRFMFGGELLSNYTNSTGLTNTISVNSVDASSSVVFGTNAAGQTVMAPQIAVRGYGGFVNLGFPLSRIFNAKPGSRNSGWTLYLNQGLDAVDHYDFVKAKAIGASGAGPYRSTMSAATVLYKINNWCTIAYEQSLYSSYALPNAAGVYTANTSIRGIPSRTWRDLRTEFGPLFTF